MTKKDIAKQVLATSGGIAKTADFIDAGLAKYDVHNLYKIGYIERIRHGYYQLATDIDATEEKLLASLLPEGIICVESALFHYGYRESAPEHWTVAVPRTISRTRLKIDSVPIKAYYIPAEQHELGRATSDFDGVTLSVYDRERTICDCFKYRTRLGNETFSKAINAYVADDKKNLHNLAKYAKEMRIFKKVNDLMEVMLNV